MIFKNISEANNILKSYYFVTIITLTVIFATSCTKDNESTSLYGNGKGMITFWCKSDLGVGNITVTLDGQTIGTISHFNSSGPQCGKEDVNFAASVGTHTFLCSAGSSRWSGTITIKEGECFSQELLGGGTGGGGGTGNGCQFSLVGKWLRQSSPYTGLVITYDGSRGIVTSAPTGSCFPVGDVKWIDYNSGSCSLNELSRGSSTCNNRGYSPSSIRFTDNNNLSVEGFNYIRQ